MFPLSLDLFTQDIVVWKINSEYSPNENHIILTYFKNGHHVPRHFSDRLFQGKTTTQFAEYIQNNKIDKVTFVVRHPFDRFLAGIKQHFISFCNIGAVNNYTQSYEKTSFLSEYMPYQTATRFLHDHRLWEEWLHSFDWDFLDSDVHTKRYLNCFEYFAQIFSDEGIKQNIIDVDAMTYYFATYGIFLPVEHMSGMSGRVDNYIMDFIKKGSGTLNVRRIVSNHIDPEVRSYDKLKIYNNCNHAVIDKIKPKSSYNDHYWQTLEFYKDQVRGSGR